MSAIEKAGFPNLTISKDSVLRISWASDIHFDHADPGAVDVFLRKLRRQNPQVLLLAGDIDLGKQNPPYFDETIPANGLIATLKKIREEIECHIYFICGNHDFYFSSFQEVRADAFELSRQVSKITYLHETQGIELDPQTILVGHDGWADGRAGTFWQSSMVLRDFFYIEELKVDSAKGVFTAETKRKMEALGDASAAYAEKILPSVFKTYQRALFLTHVPPFREASRHEEAVCDDNSAPFFVNQILGKTLLKIMKLHPLNHLTVLCGHTHTPAVYQPLANLVVLTAGAAYGSPQPQDPLFF